MKNRKRGDAEVAEDTAGEDVEAAVRAAARSIAERFESTYPHFEALAEDEEFLGASQRLAGMDIAFETVERLGRSSSPVVATIAHRAASLRADVPAEWLGWAFRRLKRGYAGEVLFLLQGIERHGEPPFIARVLARADHDWTEGWLLEVVTSFVERRVRAGEQPTAAEFDHSVNATDEQLVADVVAALEGALPAETVRDFEQWRERRARLEFFRSFGRIWEPWPDSSALTTVGGRMSVVEELRGVLRRQGPRSALVVGEHGVGKSSVIREALRAFHDEGWFVFEASGADVLAGQMYTGQLQGRVHEIATHAADGRAIWVMPAFEDALWAGQHSRSERGLLDALRPFVETGQLVIIGELAPAAHALLVQQRPRVMSLFETFRLEPLDSDDAIAVACDWLDRVGATRRRRHDPRRSGVGHAVPRERRKSRGSACAS